MEYDPKKGTTKIWVLGSSAWYTISPSPEYRSIYENLIEKARVWLFLQERYKKFKGSGKEIPGEVTEVYKDVCNYDSRGSDIKISWWKMEDTANNPGKETESMRGSH